MDGGAHLWPPADLRLQGLGRPQAAWLAGDRLGCHPQRLFSNLFQPSFKLKLSVWEGGRIKRHHHSPLTPLQQLLRSGVLSDKEGQGLRELRKKCDPLAPLVLLIRVQRASAMAGDLRSFLKGLQALWRQSRPLQIRPKPRQGRCSRVDPFEAHADPIPQWLEAEADVGSQ